MIDALVTDLVTTSEARIEAQRLGSADEVRRSATRSIALSDELDGARRELKTFLFDRFYNHPTVLSRTRRAEAVVEDLFKFFSEIRHACRQACVGAAERRGRSGRSPTTSLG